MDSTMLSYSCPFEYVFHSVLWHKKINSAVTKASGNNVRLCKLSAFYLF